MDLTNKLDRKKLIQDIENTENKGRKYESLRQTEVFNDRIYDHVYEELIRRTNKINVLEMPIVSSINLARRIAKQEASIYKNPPARDFTDVTDDQKEVINRIYKDMAFNSKMLMSNESFKYQNQNHIMFVPKDGKIMMRVLRNHHLDSIDDPMNPEKPLGYVISQIDKNEVRRNRRNNAGGTGFRGQYDSWTDQEGNFKNDTIGDQDDFELRRKKYAVWTKDFNFIMNGKGDIISGDDITNPFGIIPIIDISIEKDFEYWVRQGDSLSDFTIQFNAMLSDTSQVLRMQGYAQSYLIGKDDLIPESVQTGPNFLLKLPVEEGSSVRPEFGFANPGADLGGTIGVAESFLAMFLTSRGLDPSTVSGSGQVNKPNSGIERLLMMLEMFEASRSDFDTYEMAERKAYKIIKAIHNASLGSDLLDREYQSTNIAEESELTINFAGPEMITTQNDKIDMWKKRIEEGEATVVDMMMDLRGVGRDRAMEILQENQSIEAVLGGMGANRLSEQPGNETP